MGGFVVLDGDCEWAVANWVWRAVFERATDRLPAAADSAERVSLAVASGIHYLDLSDASTETRDEVRRAVSSVRADYEAEGESAWVAPISLQAFLAALDELEALLAAKSA